MKTLICIPGTWRNWQDCMAAIVTTTNGGYVAAGNILMDTQQGLNYAIEFCERDVRMKDSFAVAGLATGVSEAFLSEIEKHKSVLYIGGITGNLEKAHQLASTATVLLQSGGIGIKIETAGKAFEKEKWLGLNADFEEANLYKMFVLDSITEDDGTVFSCGMHNLGFRDTIVKGLEFQEAVALISLFHYYQIIDDVQVIHHQTFTLEEDSPKFRISNEPDQPYKGDELFENPFGMWRLSPE